VNDKKVEKVFHNCTAVQQVSRTASCSQKRKRQELKRRRKTLELIQIEIVCFVRPGTAG
jgi:phage terminase Nu1 subunit (DNA packaging protein)